MSLYDKLHNFGSMIYTVGDGSPHGNVSKTHVNRLSRGNVIGSVKLLEQNRDSLLFIAGGNSGEKGKRGDGMPGSLREAERMVEYIRSMIARKGATASVLERVMTDCDPEFHDRYHLRPSGNTIENAQNAVAVLEDSPMNETDIVAEINHLPRVIGTFRKKLLEKGLLAQIVRMQGHPVISSFEEDTEQEHIQSLQNFLHWEFKAKVHHILTGAVPQAEFLREWIQARWKKLRGTALAIEADDGTEYYPDMLYQEICTEPLDTRYVGLIRDGEFL